MMNTCLLTFSISNISFLAVYLRLKSLF